MEDLDRAIITKEQVVRLTHDGHPNLAAALNNLGIALWDRFERTGLKDLDRAIAINEQAIVSTLDGHPNLTIRL
jgi:hypothetical protein